MPQLSDVRIITRIMTRPAGPNVDEKFDELGPFDDEDAAMAAALEKDCRGAGVVVYQRWSYPNDPQWVDFREVYTANA